MSDLTPEQRAAVDHEGSVCVMACPGSGKTRVLTHRVERGLRALTSSKHRVVAMTFTNRATDELQSRLDHLSVETAQLWAGTIHSFALEWVLRPYAPYDARLRAGFSVADEFITDPMLHELRREYGPKPFLDISTALNRDGEIENEDAVAAAIANEYKRRLQERKLLDYDDILFHAYSLVTARLEIAQTLNQILRLICVDEIQDTQDLQYGILAAIVKTTNTPPTLFFVGDMDQCIYESLGSKPMPAAEIATACGLETIDTLHLTGNYRSTQRLIDFYQQFRPNNPKIESLTAYKDEAGLISFHRHSITFDDMPQIVASLIQVSLAQQVPAHEICVLAPQWWHVRSLGRTLVRLLPEIGFDAPGLSALHVLRDNLWFKFARLLLTTADPRLYISRLRWAGELLHHLKDCGAAIPEHLSTARQFLRFVNSLGSPEEEGLVFLREIFQSAVSTLGLDLQGNERLNMSHTSFFLKAQERLDELKDPQSTSVESFRRLFRRPGGVVVSTCHAVKGEGYETVIAVGLLEGYVPNWRVKIHGAAGEADEQASRLLYVIASRAKKRLHLIAESGRLTNSRKEYQPTEVLSDISFKYDRLKLPERSSN